MMSATALRISSQQWTSSLLSQKASQLISQKTLPQIGNNVSSAHGAMMTPGLRRGFSNRHIINKPALSKEEIWKRNFSRLYARRMLQLAALAAARQNFVTELEQVIDQPEQWENWQYRDWTEDLLQSLGASKWKRFWVSTKRIVSLSALAAPGIVLVPLSYVSDSGRDFSWNYALWGIEHAGPTFIKLIQWATTRADMFSPEFCLHFGKLRDETTGHAFAETQRILDEELGKDHAKILDMNPKPIGSGCIAQVYYGTLKEAAGKYPKGTEVALKIQHPGIWHKVCVDFYLLGKFARFLEGIPKLNLKYLSLADTVRQFRDIMLPQLDLTLEAKHLQHFNSDFSNDNTVTFPHPINELTSPMVLVETFVSGTPIMEFTKAPPEIKKQLAQIGLKTTLKMIFLNDFVHGGKTQQQQQSVIISFKW
jgi:aarF domain-containing kinase